MSKKDYSRLEEEFYLEVGENDEIILSTFIDKALKFYIRRFPKYKTQSITKIISFSMDKFNCINFIIKSFNEEAEVIGVKLRSKHNYLSDLLRYLQGNLIASYSNLSMEDIPFKIKQGINEKYDSPLGLNVNYKKGNTMLSQISFEKDGSSNKSLAERLDSIGFEEKELVLKADEIKIVDEFYEGSDKQKSLLQSSCLIRKKDSEYYFKFSLRTADFSPVANVFYAPVEGLFNLASKNFSIKSFYGIKAVDFSQQGRL